MSIHIPTVVIISEDSSKEKKVMCVCLRDYGKEMGFLKTR